MSKEIKELERVFFRKLAQAVNPQETLRTKVHQLSKLFNGGTGDMYSGSQLNALEDRLGRESLGQEELTAIEVKINNMLMAIRGYVQGL